MKTYQTKERVEHIETNLQNIVEQLHDLQHKNNELQDKIGELELLLKLNSLASQLLDRDETLKEIQKLFVKSFGLDEYVLLLRTDSDKELEISSHYGVTPDKGVWVKVSDNNHILNKIYTKGDSVYFPDLTHEQHKELLTIPGKAGSLLSLPLISENKTVIGILNLLRARENAFTEEEIRFLQLMATHAAGVIDKTILFHNTQELAYTDALTSIFNRRYFEQRYAREFLRARRYKRSLSILMIDIDHFKEYNDTYGHLMGDKVLQKVAQVLEAQLRRADIVCRYGGEEFVVLLPEIDLKNAFHVAEKLRLAVANAEFSPEDKMPDRRVTISIGIASFPENGDNDELILDKADKALYRAKAKGRNRVETANGQA